MCNKKYLNNIKLVFYNLKSMRTLYYVPIVTMFLLIPISLFLDKTLSKNIQLTYMNGLTWIQTFVPFLSIWWILFGFREYIEGSGVEVLKTYKKQIVLDVLLVFIWYTIHILFMLLLLMVAVDLNYFNYIIYFIIQSMAYSFITLFLSIIMKNIALPFFIAIFYLLFGMLNLSTLDGMFSLMIANQEISVNSIMHKFVIAVVVSIISLIFSKNFYRKI